MSDISVAAPYAARLEVNPAARLQSESAESFLERKVAEAREAVREEPIKMMALAAVSGMVLGALLVR